ncbi:MAG: thiamine pyrophosphate-binding protein [Actinomycetota bacterium]
MTPQNAFSDAIVQGLLSWGVDVFVHVPSSHIVPVIRGLEERGVSSLLANREEEAVGIAGGLVLGGKKAAVVMQDNGFGNCLTSLATFAKAYHLALPVVANTRGGPGEYNAMIHSFSEAVPDLLHAIDVRVERLTAEGSPLRWREATEAAAKLATISHRPVVVLADLLHPTVAAAR